MEDEKRKRTTVLAPHPFLDTLALLWVLVSLPGPIVVLAKGLFVIRQLARVGLSRTAVLRILVLSAVSACVTIYSLASPYGVFDLFATACIAASLGGSSDWLVHAFYCTFLALSLRISGHFRDAPLAFVVRSLPSLETRGDRAANTVITTWAVIKAMTRFLREINWKMHYREVLDQYVSVTVVTFALSQKFSILWPRSQEQAALSKAAGTAPLPSGTEAFPIKSAAKTGHNASQSSDGVRYERRLAKVRAKQPLWSALAGIYVRYLGRGEDECDPLPLPVISYVEHAKVGLLVENPASVRFFIDGMEWPLVYFQKGTQLVVICGLVPCRSYDVTLVDDRERACKLTIHTAALEGMDLSDHKLPEGACEAALEFSQIELADAKSRLRKVRKDNAKLLSGLRSEIDSLSARISRSEKADSRSARKIAGLQDSERLLRDEIGDIIAATEMLDARRTEAESAYRMREKEWVTEKSLREQKLRELDSRANEIAEAKTLLEAELARAQNRATKMKQKLERATTDAQRLWESMDKSVDQLLEKRRRLRETRVARHATQRVEFEAAIKRLQVSTKEMQERAKMFSGLTEAWGPSHSSWPSLTSTSSESYSHGDPSTF